MRLVVFVRAAAVAVLCCAVVCSGAADVAATDDTIDRCTVMRGASAVGSSGIASALHDAVASLLSARAAGSESAASPQGVVAIVVRHGAATDARSVSLVTVKRLRDRLARTSEAGPPCRGGQSVLTLILTVPLEAAPADDDATAVSYSVVAVSRWRVTTDAAAAQPLRVLPYRAEVLPAAVAAFTRALADLVPLAAAEACASRVRLRDAALAKAGADDDEAEGAGRVTGADNMAGADAADEAECAARAFSAVPRVSAPGVATSILRRAETPAELVAARDGSATAARVVFVVSDGTIFPSFAAAGGSAADPSVVLGAASEGRALFVWLRWWQDAATHDDDDRGGGEACGRDDASAPDAVALARVNESVWRRRTAEAEARARRRGFDKEAILLALSDVDVDDGAVAFRGNASAADAAPIAIQAVQFVRDFANALRWAGFLKLKLTRARYARCASRLVTANARASLFPRSVAELAAALRPFRWAAVLLLPATEGAAAVDARHVAARIVAARTCSSAGRGERCGGLLELRISGRRHLAPLVVIDGASAGALVRDFAAHVGLPVDERSFAFVDRRDSRLVTDRGAWAGSTSSIDAATTAQIALRIWARASGDRGDAGSLAEESFTAAGRVMDVLERVAPFLARTRLWLRVTPADMLGCVVAIVAAPLVAGALVLLFRAIDLPDDAPATRELFAALFGGAAAAPRSQAVAGVAGTAPDAQSARQQRDDVRRRR
jgi:hypothetical protein